MFRKFRILLLLFVFATVAVGAWRAKVRLTAWEHTVHVALYPVAAEDSPATQRFVAALEPGAFAAIPELLDAQAAAHGRGVLQPVALHLAPPLPPSQAGIMGGRIAIAPGKAEIPAGLGDAVIGPATAREIGLLRSTR